MGQRKRRPEFDRPKTVLLADLQRWLNTIKRKPGAEPAKYDHRDVKAYLESLEVPLERMSGKDGSWFRFRLADLRQQAPLLAAAFERGATTATEAQDAVEA